MKNVSITKSGRNPVQKNVSLGNGQRKIFGSKRAANYFVAETNRFLTKVLVSTNDVLIGIYGQYRAMWFVTTNSHHGKKLNGLSEQNSINGHLKCAEDMLDKFTFTDGGSNDAFFAFIDLKKAALFLLEAAKEIMEFHKKRKETSGFYATQMLHDRCLSILNSLTTYGQ